MSPRLIIVFAALLLAASGCTCGDGTMRVGGVTPSAHDAGSPQKTPADAGADAGAVVPQQELCGNGIDDDGDGLIDEDCACTVGTTRPCFSGNPAQQGIGACHAGVQTCETQDEFGTWGACQGEVLPTAETCNGVDDDCNGAVDELLTQACTNACGAGTQVCTAGAWGTCTGRTPTPEVCNGLDDDCDGVIDNGVTRSCASMCGTGTEVCTAGSWGGCDARLPTTEICGNGIDENCDGVDDACVCIHSPSQTAWQIHQGEPPTCWPQTFPSNGAVGEYQYSTIPSETDPGWAPEAAPNISFDTRSTMCGSNGAPDLCACRAGGDFTYFQTSFDIPSSFTVASLVVSIADVDDGVKVTIFNANHPNGVVGGYAFLGGGATADVAQYIISGKNRIVLTHIDDCCSERRIRNAFITLNGSALNPCP